MNISKLLSTSLVALSLSLCLPMSACDGGDDGGDTADEGNADETTGGDGDGDGGGDGDGDTGSEDIACSVYCVSFIEMCLQTGMSSEFETDAACNEACAMWDQAGVNCRYQQIVDGACGEAGNMGSSCQ